MRESLFFVKPTMRDSGWRKAVSLSVPQQSAALEFHSL
jgi:hypothetical protein